MSQHKKFILTILSGSNDKNIDFNEMCSLLSSLDFLLRINGSHHIFYRDDVEDIINIQPKNGKVKPYQVKQIRNVIIEYKLGGDFNV